MPGGLDRAAITTGRTAACIGPARKLRRSGHHRDAAAVAVGCSGSRQPAGGIHRGTARRAELDCSAPLPAGSVKRCASQGNIGAGNRNGAAGAADSSDGAGNRDAAVACIENDLAAVLMDRSCRNRAARTDDIGHQIAGRTRAEQHRRAGNLTVIDDKRLHRPAVGIDRPRNDICVKREGDQAVAGKIQCEDIGRTQGHTAQPGRHDAVVAHGRRDQPDQTVGNDRAIVHDHGIRIAGPVERGFSGGDVFVAGVAGGRHERTRVDLGVRAEDDAVAVDENDPAVSQKIAENLRWIVAADAVDRERVRARLIEFRGLALRDVEARPVDDHDFGLLIDLQGAGSRGADRGRAGNHLSAHGVADAVVRRGKERHQQGQANRPLNPVQI